MLFKLIVYEDKYMNSVREVYSWEDPKELISYLERHYSDAAQHGVQSDGLPVPPKVSTSKSGELLAKKHVRNRRR